MLTTGQVMFCYVCAPWALPPSYYRFILTTGPMHEAALQTMRRRAFGRPLKLDALRAFYAAAGGEREHGPFPLAALAGGLVDASVTHVAASRSSSTLLTADGSARVLTSASAAVRVTQRALDRATRARMLVPCAVTHPHTRTCRNATWLTFRNAFRRTLPVYSSVFALAALVRWRHLMREPKSTLAHVVLSTLRSSTFLASFVAACMALVCVTRRVMPHESWPTYWGLAFLSAGAIFIERPSRRIELALYVLPRAVDSLFLIATRMYPRLNVFAGARARARFAPNANRSPRSQATSATRCLPSPWAASFATTRRSRKSWPALWCKSSTR